MCQPVSDSSRVVVLSRHQVLHSCLVYHIYTLSIVTFVPQFVTGYGLSNVLRGMNVCTFVCYRLWAEHASTALPLHVYLCLLQNELFWDTTDLGYFDVHFTGSLRFYWKIYNVWGGLTDMTAKTKSLTSMPVETQSRQRVWNVQCLYNSTLCLTKTRRLSCQYVWQPNANWLINMTSSISELNCDCNVN